MIIFVLRMCSENCLEATPYVQIDSECGEIELGKAFKEIPVYKIIDYLDYFIVFIAGLLYLFSIGMLIIKVGLEQVVAKKWNFRHKSV